VEPNPVAAGSSATLSVDFDGLSGDYNGGLSASWECWDGNAWVETHLIARAFNGYGPDAIDLSTESTIVLPDIGLVIPNSHQIAIPDVAPGLYRLTDYMYGYETTFTAHEIVEVES